MTAQEEAQQVIDSPHCQYSQAELRRIIAALIKYDAREREFICKKCGIRQELGVKEDVEF